MEFAAQRGFESAASRCLEFGQSTPLARGCGLSVCCETNIASSSAELTSSPRAGIRRYRLLFDDHDHDHDKQATQTADKQKDKKTQTQPTQEANTDNKLHQAEVGGWPRRRVGAQRRLLSSSRGVESSLRWPLMEMNLANRSDVRTDERART